MRTIIAQIADIVRIVLAGIIFTNSYVDPVQITAIVRIAIWQPNQFVHDLAPVFVILVAYHTLLSRTTPQHTTTNKRQPQHTAITLLCHRTMANAPPIKP